MFTEKLEELVKTAWSSLEGLITLRYDRIEERQDHVVDALNDLNDWVLILADQNADRVAECFERRLGEHKGKVTSTELKALVRQAVQDAQQGK